MITKIDCPICSWSMQVEEGKDTLTSVASAKLAEQMGVPPNFWQHFAMRDHQREVEATLHAHFSEGHSLAEWVAKVVELQNKINEMAARRPRELGDY